MHALNLYIRSLNLLYKRGLPKERERVVIKEKIVATIEETLDQEEKKRKERRGSSGFQDL